MCCAGGGCAGKGAGRMGNREPIGVFDSGVGGISVLRELIRIMPNENYLYLGDSENAPYGTRSLEEVRALTFENVERLLQEGAKGVVIACNTATSAAVAALREKYPQLPLVGMVGEIVAPNGHRYQHTTFISS